MSDGCRVDDLVCVFNTLLATAVSTLGYITLHGKSTRMCRIYIPYIATTFLECCMAISKLLGYTPRQQRLTAVENNLLIGNMNGD